MKRSEEEIRRALNRATMEINAAAFIRAIRLIAGLEGTDNNQLRETP